MTDKSVCKYVMQYGLITAGIASTECKLIAMSLIHSNEYRTIRSKCIDRFFLGGKAMSFIF